MIRIFVFLAALLAPGVAWAQGTPVVEQCNTGNPNPNAWGPCPGNLPTTNRSVVITLGATFQTVVASTVTGRRSLTIENNNTSGDNCYVYIGSSGQTEAAAILLIKGGSYTRYWPFVPNDTIQATCDTTNDTLYVDTQ
jgi:hypothetical protein